MALGGTQQSAPQLAPINPANLIGQADPNIVEPRAVGILTDAFHKGVISAEDITARIGEVGQAKKKAELDMANAASMQATEAQSPEAIAARQQQLATTTAQGQVQQAQAERAKIIAQYPAVEYFDKLAAKAGIAEPKLPDGTPDYKEMEKIGLELALDTSKKLTATDERKNIEAQFDADNQVVRAFTKQGVPVDSGRVRELDRIINTPFSRQAPGSMATAPVVGPAPVVEARGAAAAPLENLDTVRARLAETFGSAEAVMGMDEAELRRSDALAKPTELVQPVSKAGAPVEVAPRGTPSAGALPFGTPTAGGYAMGGTPKELPGVKMASEQQKSLAQSALTREQVKSIGDSFTKLQADSPWLTGPVMGRLGTLVSAENWNTARADFERSTTAMLANLAKGIYHETGVLSDKDIARYQKAMPNVNDTADVAKVKLNGVTRDIFNSIDTNIETMKGQGQALTPVIQGMQDAAKLELQRLNNPAQSATAGAAGGGAAPVVALPSGKKITRDASGNFVYVE